MTIRIGSYRMLFLRIVCLTFVNASRFYGQITQSLHCLSHALVMLPIVLALHRAEKFDASKRCTPG